jgi:hypothetical protein
MIEKFVLAWLTLLALLLIALDLTAVRMVAGW